MLNAHLPVVGIEPIGGYITESVLHCQCDARLAVTIAAIELHHPLQIYIEKLTVMSFMY